MRGGMAAIIDREIADHGEEERFELGGRPVRIGPGRRQEGVLDQVFGVGRMADADPGEADQFGAIGAVEVCEGAVRGLRRAGADRGLGGRGWTAGLQMEEVWGQGAVGHGRHFRNKSTTLLF